MKDQVADALIFEFKKAFSLFDNEGEDPEIEPRLSDASSLKVVVSFTPPLMPMVGSIIELRRTYQAYNLMPLLNEVLRCYGRSLLNPPCRRTPTRARYLIDIYMYSYGRLVERVTA